MSETFRIGLVVVAAIIITNPEFRQAVKDRFNQLMSKWNKFP